MIKNFKKKHREAYEWIKAMVSILFGIGAGYFIYICLWLIGGEY